MTVPDSPCGNLQRRVADFAGLLTEDRAQQALLRGQLGFALRGHVADQDVAGRDLGTDADDAALVEVGQHFLAHIGDVPGDFLRPELGVAGVTSYSSIWIEVSRSSETRRWDRMIASS